MGKSHCQFYEMKHGFSMTPNLHTRLHLRHGATALATLLFVAFGLQFPAALMAAPPDSAAAKERFDKADQELNAAWAAAKTQFSEERMKEIATVQRQWVGYRDIQADAAQEKAGGKTKSSAWYEKAASLSLDRAAWLQRAVKNEGEPVTGVWIDGQGGTLEVVEKNGQLYFDLNTVRGPGYDLGVIAGTALWNAPLGWFSDKGRDPEKKDESNLAFIYKDLYLQLVSANAEHYHGRRAYLDGRYFKVASLDTETQSLVVKAGQTGKSQAVPD
jgi:uncharacterized protein YecT (DUF1311 family)